MRLKPHSNCIVSSEFARFASEMEMRSALFNSMCDLCAVLSSHARAHTQGPFRSSPSATPLNRQRRAPRVRRVLRVIQRNTRCRCRLRISYVCVAFTPQTGWRWRWFLATPSHYAHRNVPAKVDGVLYRPYKSPRTSLHASASAINTPALG